MRSTGGAAGRFGAGTSTSEFEFLTGNSMNFLPSGSIPYQQYILGPTDSLATLLKGYGYETRAFHPGEQTSWQRFWEGGSATCSAIISLRRAGISR
ncbi:MAG: sulfatase-like hydrolase/transferase [Eubacteriales bacterium]